MALPLFDLALLAMIRFLGRLKKCSAGGVLEFQAKYLHHWLQKCSVASRQPSLISCSIGSGRRRPLKTGEKLVEDFSCGPIRRPQAFKPRVLKCYRELLKRRFLNSKGDHSRPGSTAILFVLAIWILPVTPSADDLIHSLTRDAEAPRDRSLRLYVHETEDFCVCGTWCLTFPPTPSPLL